MATYNLGVRLETLHNVDAKNLKDAFKKVKESWKDMHDIELNDYDITAYKDMGIRYEDKYGVKMCLIDNLMKLNRRIKHETLTEKKSIIFHI
tara:strand:+ start:491 stop:766 length:276 start_codon:yes stop_codon:yes gene_type:complete